MQPADRGPWFFLWGPHFSYLDVVGILLLTYFYAKGEWLNWQYWILLFSWVMLSTFVGAFIRAHLRWKSGKR